MDTVSIYNFQNYKPYLLAWIRNRPHRGRGTKLALAEACRCQSAYISRVLHGSAHFSLEHAEGVNRYLGHSEEERHYFLLMIQKERAGLPTLERYFAGQMEQIQQKRLVLKDRFQVKMDLSAEDQVTYYSAWFYAAAHILTTVPRFKTKEAIASQLGLSLQKTGEVLEFLSSTGLVKEDGGLYSIGNARIHLGNDSGLISKHHTNWRLQALQSLDRDDHTQKNEDLHYTSIVSLSESDFRELKAKWIEEIEHFNTVVKESPEETLACLTLDFFKP
jgi:uncharacterized protein (TIGR02147 family)